MASTGIPKSPKAEASGKSQSDREWLEALKKELRKRVHSNEYAARRNLITHERVRHLTKTEVKRIKSVASKFVVEPRNACMGFNFGLIFYDHPPVPGIKPEAFFWIDGEDLPKEIGQSFNDSWNTLSPLSHNEENKRLLAFYKMKEPQGKSHYSY